MEENVVISHESPHKPICFPTINNPSFSLSLLLDRSIECVEKLGDDFEKYYHLLVTLNTRQTEGHFNLAVLGQFKRGKSTFLNALLGEPILPSSIVPLTAIPTFIRHSQRKSLRIVFDNEMPDFVVTDENSETITTTLFKYVSEEANPENKEDVSYVEIFHQSPILSRGLVLIDTPGIGSTYRHNTETTLNFLPQCDGVFFLISADPPITETEISFLKEVLTRVERIFFILNKTDYLSMEERKKAIDFFRQTLNKQCNLSLDT